MQEKKERASFNLLRDHFYEREQVVVKPVYIRREVEIAGVPVLVADDGQPGPKPAVVWYHGFTQCNEAWIQTAMELAQAGIYVVMPEVLGHGWRKNPDHFRISGLLKTTIEEAERIIHWLKEQDFINAEQIGMGGGSFGGMVTNTVIGRGNVKIKAAVIYSSTPDLLNTTEKKEDPLFTPEAAKGKSINMMLMTPEMVMGEEPLAVPTEEEILLMKQQAMEVFKDNPAERQEAFKDVSLEILHGKADVTLPKESGMKFYDRLVAEYPDADAVYYLHEGAQHAGNNNMDQQFVNWMIEHLCEGGVQV